MIEFARRFVNPGFVRMFFHNYRLLRRDPRCSARALFAAMREAVEEERVVRHDGRLVYSSFLPPIPSRAAEQAFHATDDSNGVFEGLITGRRSAPISMYVSVTGRCPFRCAHCSAAGRCVSRELSTVEMKRLLSDLQDMGTSIIGLTGGEPLVREDLTELIAVTNDRSVVFLFTTGFGLDAAKAKELKRAGLFAVGISLDSTEPAEMDAFRGVEGAHAAAVAAVRHCRDAGLYTMTQTVADRVALESGRLAKVAAFSQKIGAHEIRILENMPSGRFASLAPDRILTEEDRAALKVFHAEMNRKRGGIKVSVFAHTEAAERFGCGAGTQHSYIDATGHLYPCDFVPVSFGNVLERPVAELWREMHRQIGKPRQTCMVLELYMKKLLEDASSLPLSPDESAECIKRLDPVMVLPGFYRRSAGERKNATFTDESLFCLEH